MRPFELDYKLILDLDKIVALEGPFNRDYSPSHYKIHLVSGEIWERSLIMDSTEYDKILKAWLGE